MGSGGGLRRFDGGGAAGQGVHRRTVKGAVAGGYGDDAARFYAAEAAKVIQAFFHAAALTGRSLDDVLRWVANPTSASEPTEVLLQHPMPRPIGWDCCTARCTVMTAPPATRSPPPSRR